MSNRLTPLMAVDHPPRAAYSVRETAQMLGISEIHAKREIYAGRLRARKSGKRTLVPADALREYLAPNGDTK